MSSSLPARGQSGFVGLRVSAWVTVVCVLGVLPPLAILVSREDSAQASIVQIAREIDIRQDAVRTSVAALDAARRDSAGLSESAGRAFRRAAVSDARWLAMRLSRDLGVSGHGESRGQGDDAARLRKALESARVWDGRAEVGILEEANGELRVVGSGFVPSSDALTALWDGLIQSASRSAALDRETEALAVEGLGVGRYWVVRIPVQALGLEVGNIDRARRALSSIVEPIASLPSPRSSAGLVLAAALSTALLGFAWVRFRLGRPLDLTLQRALAFAHGDATARADEQRGGRDARDLARMVNALMERAERLKRQGQKTRDEDIGALTRALEDLGKGDMTSSLPSVQEPLDGVLRALACARQDLLERMRNVRDLSLEIATSAADLAPAAQRIRVAAREQVDGLVSIGRSANQGALDVAQAHARLVSATIELGTFAAEERRAMGAFRAALFAAGRRAQDLRRDSARIEALSATAEAIEDALDLLAVAIDPTLVEARPLTKADVALAVGEGRAALESITRELALLRDELGGLAVALESSARGLPESLPALEASIAANLQAVTSGFVGVAEQVARGIRFVERAATSGFESVDELQTSVMSSAELAPQLGAAIAGLQVSGTFESELLARVERWREEAKQAAEAHDGLTEQGRAIVRQVTESGEAVRVRLARLVSLTESAVEVLRA